jgi:hypothetical protein
VKAFMSRHVLWFFRKGGGCRVKSCHMSARKPTSMAGAENALLLVFTMSTGFVA